MASKPNPRNANGHRRRELRRRVLAEETHCGICGQPVDKTLTTLFGEHGKRCTRENCEGCVPHPMRPEVDEITPVSLGGSPYQRSNCRLTHRECNRKRGNGAQATPKPVTQVTFSPIW